MKVSVNENHIKAGRGGEMCYCPIALAIKDAIPTAKEVYVGMRSYIWQKKAFAAACVDSTDYRISLQVVRFAVAFDQGKPIKPFTFRLMPLERKQ